MRASCFDDIDMVLCPFSSQVNRTVVRWLNSVALLLDACPFIESSLGTAEARAQTRLQRSMSFFALAVNER
jgi:hypothetical protein